MLDSVEHERSGPYDVVSPVGHATMRDVLEACVVVTGSDAELRWVAPAPILQAGVEPSTDLPIWLPPGELHDAMHRSDVSCALDAGLRCRPVAETWTWLRSLDAPPQPPDRDYLPRIGVDPALEAHVLADLPDGPDPTSAS